MRYKSVQLPEMMVKEIRKVIDERGELGYVSIKGFVEDAVRRRLETIRDSQPAGNPLAASCPTCGGSVAMERVEDLNICEYRATCQACKWAGTLRKLRCGGCHGEHLFEWTSESWRCIDCGHVRRDQSPPRGMEAGREA